MKEKPATLTAAGGRKADAGGRRKDEGVEEDIDGDCHENSAVSTANQR